MKIELLNKAIAGIISLLAGLIAFIFIYGLLGYITEPFVKWLEFKALGGAHK